MVIGPGVLQFVRKLLHLRCATRSKSKNARCGGADASNDEQELRHDENPPENVFRGALFVALFRGWMPRARAAFARRLTRLVRAFEVTDGAADRIH